MKVEIYHEVLATRPHPSGGEAYDASTASTWILQDHVDSDDCEIIASFLNGLADELDPPYIHGQSQKQGISITTCWRINIYRSGEIPVTTLTSKRAKLVAATLRGAASAVTQVQLSVSDRSTR